MAKAWLSDPDSDCRRFACTVCHTGTARRDLPRIFKGVTLSVACDRELEARPPLPQLYSDQFGWKEMVATVGKVYNGLTADVRAKTAIFARNYGQAGASDLFGHRYGLPKAISGHQNYFFWGPPRVYRGKRHRHARP
jgi:hypothetical protein